MRSLDPYVFLRKRIIVFLGAMICCGLWGSAYPFVKKGFEMLSIDSGDTGSIVLYAGFRFTLAGILVVIIGSIGERKLLVPRSAVQLRYVFILSMFQCIGQYFFYYIGLAHTSGVNTSIVDSLSYFSAIIFSCLVYRMEPFTLKKALGCILGFSGVVIVNITGSGFSFDMTFMGEGLILISAICYGFSSVYSHKFSQHMNPIALSGNQFIAGGIVLIILGFIMGGEPGAWSWSGSAVAVTVYLALVSTVAFTLWTVLLKFNDVSAVSIYGFMNPVFGLTLSALILHEHQGFAPRYLVALVVISTGILLVNLKNDQKTRSLE